METKRLWHTVSIVSRQDAQRLKAERGRVLLINEGKKEGRNEKQ